MTQYNPKTVFRRTDNQLLREFFESKGRPIDVAWGEIGNLQIQTVYEAFLTLSDAHRRELEIDLHDLHAVAQSGDGISLLVEMAVDREYDIIDELNAFDSRYDKAMTVLLKYPQVWDEAVPLIHAGTLSKRYWRRRNSLPQQSPDVTETALAVFKQDLSSFYWQAEGRGQLCRIDHIRRNNALDYFFVYLSDHADADMTWDDDGNWRRVRSRHAFEVVYVFDHTTGVIDIYAHGGKKVVRPLQEIFAKAILDVDLDPEGDSIAYHVDGLMNRSFSFVTDPGDGITDVAVRMLRMHPVGNKKKKITVKFSGDSDPEEIYVALENDLNLENLSPNSLRVERATISMRLKGYGRKKTLTFDIGPKSCTLKSELERFFNLGEKYLRLWGLDRAK
jgi:hypothetical protein